MKKSVGKSLVLLALGLGALSLLGGRSVFSKVLSNLKSTPTPKKEEKILEEKQDKESVRTEIALEAKESETPVAEPTPKEPFKQVETARKPEPQKRVQETKTKLSKSETKKQNPKFTAPKIRETATKKALLKDGRYTLTFENGEKIEYDKHGMPLWSSRHGRLADTEEETKWWGNYKSPFNDKGSSGSEGTGILCLTPEKNYEVQTEADCFKNNKWWF